MRAVSFARVQGLKLPVEEQPKPIAKSDVRDDLVERTGTGTARVRQVDGPRDLSALEDALALELGDETLAHVALGNVREHLGALPRALAPAPALVWDPGLLARGANLDVEGVLAGSPFATRSAAFAAVLARRGEAPDHTFLITRGPAGFVAFEYDEDRLGRVDLGELDPRGLPLVDPAAPRTWIVDARGRVGGLVREGGGYTIKPLALDRRGELVPEGEPGTRPFNLVRGAPLFRLREPAPVDASIPFVVPRRQVNHGQNVSWTPAFALRPGTELAELSRALRYVHEHLPPGTKIKAGGSRHSWSKVAATDGVYVLPEGIRFIEPLGGKLVRVGSGTRVREVNAALWAQGLSLPALGGFDGQTIGGVLPTGTHGSVLGHGPLADMVRSIDLVRADGTPIRIEPANGITDADELRAEHPEMELVQDDALFGAALINMGTMGVVHSYVLEAADRFHLTERRTETTAGELVRGLRGGNIYHLMDVDHLPEWTGKDDGRRFPGHPEKAHHLEFLVNPHSDKVTVTSRQPTKLEREPHDMSERPGRDLFRALSLGRRYTRPELPTWIAENFPKAVGFTTEKLTELVPGVTPALVDAAMSSLPDHEYTQRSYNVFNIGDGANALPALSGTVFVPLRGDRYLRALEIIRETAKQYAEETGRYQTGPISLRFVKGTGAPLAAAEDVCSFEIIFAGGTDHAEELMKRYIRALAEELGGDVKYHWGQLLPGVTREDVRASYPRAEEWKRLRDRLDPEERFLNDWQASLF